MTNHRKLFLLLNPFLKHLSNANAVDKKNINKLKDCAQMLEGAMHDCNFDIAEKLL